MSPKETVDTRRNGGGCGICKIKEHWNSYTWAQQNIRSVAGCSELLCLPQWKLIINPNDTSM